MARRVQRNATVYCILSVAVDWSECANYIAKHGVTPEQADDALNDANAVIFDPDAPLATRPRPGCPERDRT